MLSKSSSSKGIALSDVRIIWTISIKYFDPITMHDCFDAQNGL